MADAIAHRGPDNQGCWSDIEAGIALGHRRLAVQGLGQAGDQPMVSPSGRFVLAYNGEIYNHLELREEVEAGAGRVPWRGSSDTETLLAAIERWGLSKTLDLSRGMFALALWDRAQCSLRLARDRFGEKPLYYGKVGGSFLFASELHSLERWPAFQARISPEAVSGLLRYGYVPSPGSIYEGVFKLPPGTVLTLSAKGLGVEPSLSRWWNYRDEWEQGAKTRFKNESEVLESLDEVFSTACELQTISEVPLGAFLSGGIDSSTVVASLQARSRQPVKTFTVGFPESEYDESGAAEAIAAHLGTEHESFRLTAQDALNLVPELASIYDEPFADASQIPTALVCRLARQHVTVALSGDAGDELFGGYQRYVSAAEAWAAARRTPGFARPLLARVLQNEVVLSLISKRAGHGLGISHPSEKLRKFGKRIVTARNEAEFYELLTAINPDNQELIAGVKVPAQPPYERFRELPKAGYEERMMYADALTYLPDDILTKVDRAAMSASLETRLPFLDIEVVRLACRLPLNMKLRDRKGKYLIRRLLEKRVPPELFDRPKHGFAVPLAEWLRGPLKAWSGDLLSSIRPHSALLNRKEALRLFEEHSSGSADHAQAIWSILMLQAWRQSRSC